MMVFLRLTIQLVLLFSASSALAFSKDRCGHLFPTADGDHPPYFSPIYISTMIPSTTSYFSSIGPCSMYGENSSRVSFLETEFPALQVEVARGEGERLSSFAYLSGCPVEVASRFAGVMKANYESIFHSPSDDALLLLDKVDAVIRADENLEKSCRHMRRI